MARGLHGRGDRESQLLPGGQGRYDKGKQWRCECYIHALHCIVLLIVYCAINLLRQLAATVDVFPTVMNLVGGKLPDVTLDGVDMAPILFDNKEVSTVLVSTLT